MSNACHCFNPEDAFVEDVATESVDSCADMPPLIPETVAKPTPQPLFSARDVKRLQELHVAKQRDIMTAKYQHHLNDAIDELLEERGEQIKAEMRTAIERATGVEQLKIPLLRYTKAVSPSWYSRSYTDDDGNWWTSIHAYCDSLTTTLGGVEVDFIVRKTHFLRQLAERIGDRKHFIIKKHTHVPEEHDTHKVFHMTLSLEFWPKGVTLGRRIQCEP